MVQCKFTLFPNPYIINSTSFLIAYQSLKTKLHRSLLRSNR